MKKSLLITALLMSSAVFAQNIGYTKINASSQAIARYYNLTSEEVRKYEDYMNLEGRYRYPNADPIMVLGMIADTPEDRYRYAKKAAAREIEANQKLALFSEAFAKAGKDLSGYVIKDHSIDKTYVLKADDQLMMIVDDDCDNSCHIDAERALEKAKSVTMTIYQKENNQPTKDLIALAKKAAAKNKNKIVTKSYDEFEFELNKIRLNRVMIMRSGQLLGLYQ